MVRAWPSVAMWGLSAGVACQDPAAAPTDVSELGDAEVEVGPPGDDAPSPDGEGEAEVEVEVDAATDGVPETDDDTDTTAPADTEAPADGVSADDIPPDGGDDAEVTAPTPWRSALYPADWTPGLSDASGARLQDYSYAGYHQGALPLGQGLGPDGVAGLPRVSVVDHGASPGVVDPAATTDSTAAFQAAIDEAASAGGGRVYVPAGLYRIDGRLVVGASRVVIAGDGPEASRLWFTAAGESYVAHLRFAGGEAVLAEAALTRDAATFDGSVEVADASAFSVGDDVLVGQVITEGFIAEHGMTGTWKAFNGTWQAFLRRNVVAIDTSASPHRVTLDVPVRYPLRVVHGATLRRVGGVIREVGLEGLGIANAIEWERAWQNDQVNAIAFDQVADAWVRDVASFVSPGAPNEGMGAGAHLQSNGILVSRSKRVTVADVDLAFAQHRGSGGNGYLFEVRQSSEVLTRDASARGGRHNFIQNWGFGTTGCVWLRVHGSEGGQVPLGPLSDASLPAPSEFHHSLATANLLDSCRFDDGFEAVNRGDWSTGAGHSATETVFWRYAGAELVSLQFGLGYVIGTAPGTVVSTALDLLGADGTAPADMVEGLGLGASLEPASLYEDQLARRLGVP